MKKAIPALIAIALIIVIGAATLGTGILTKFRYSDKKRDLMEYYELTAPDQVAIVLQNERIEEKAKLHQGVYYLDFPHVQSLLNDRFYADFNEGLLLYTLPDRIVRTEIGSSTYLDGEEKEEPYQISFMEEETLFVALDYVAKYTKFDYATFENPNRMQLRTIWSEAEKAIIKKDTAVRYQGGVKSDILRKIAKEETVTILEEMEKWVKVKTEDALIGYVEKKCLKGRGVVQEQAENTYEEPEYSNLVRDHKINLGWHQVMVESANDTLGEVLTNTKGLNVISPTWFTLRDNEGTVGCIASSAYVKDAHNRGLEVWALFDNFTYDISTFENLSFTSKRSKIINSLMEGANTYGFDGINVDFEMLSYDAGEHFVEFIRELSIACRANNLVLSVDNYVPRESTTHYNRKEQGIVADYVIIMGYDEHWGSGGVAGSVASIDFVEDGIIQTVAEVPSNKIINAVPFYTRVWKTKGGTVTSDALGMEAAENFVKNNGVKVDWDDATCQNYGEIQKGDTLYQVWLEDEQSITTKCNIMKKYELGGIAAWKLGFEKPSIWNVIAEYCNS